MNNKDQISIIPLGGVGDVTRNMYVYQYQNQMLIVDCGIGFADETMVGVELLVPDITYIQTALKQGKKIVGLLITHGHEDHMGALPFILPQLPDFPIYAPPLAAAMATEKLQEFGVAKKVEAVPFESDHELHLGSFSAQFIRMTHSIPDTSHIFIRTPVGNFYHGSDFKIDPTPYDNKTSDLEKIKRLSSTGVLGLLTDCLGSERSGTTPSEATLTDFFAEEMQKTKGKFVVTTYSSNINRLNQVLDAAKKQGKRVAFVGRSLINNIDTAKKLKLITLPQGMEVRVDQVKQYKPNQLVLFVAGSQGQENSALSRIANNEHKDIRLSPVDTVVFSSDAIPGNELSVNSLIDTLLKIGCTVVYPPIAHTHVSGHGSADELMQLLGLVHPKKVMPISGNYKHMVQYRKLAIAAGMRREDIIMMEDGQEVIFNANGARAGGRFQSRKVYVDEVSGEEVEGYILRDRQKLAEEGVVVIISEVDGATTTLVQNPTIIVRGLSESDTDQITTLIRREMQKMFSGKKGKVTNPFYLRRMIGETVEQKVFRQYRKTPLILPVVIEV